ncbi:MAG TPA: hypothetical protein DCY82_05000, partial [Acidimicrobiaceae bacterium]|nr:hypothetical protein [Acidimicrobiaceae bacterium]
LDVPLVVFDSVLDHILRIDRVLRQPLGHLLLVGASGVGKTTLTKFVSWMQDLEVFQIKAGRNYSVYDFDEDLRKVMRMAGVEKKKICFIFDESNVLGAGFLERMNALLAGGEVPGLFDGDDYTKLIAACKEDARKNNKMLDTEDEIYKQFTKDVQRNLHVVFTMNPPNPDFSNRSASSPALFNRCVIDWFGDWSDESLSQVSSALIKDIGVDNESFEDRIEQRRVGSGGAGAANFLVVKERNNLRARCVGLDERLDASPTRQLIVDARRGNPFVVPAAKRWRHDIVGHELKSENVVGSDSEVGGKQLHQACLLVVIVGKPPHGLKVGLFVEFETLGGYLAVEVDRELGYTQNWTVNLDQVRGHVSGHDLAREPEVPIEPAIDECTAIDLDAKLANTSRHAVGMRLDT